MEIWAKPEKIDKNSLVEIIKSYLISDELARLKMYSDYYSGNNTEIIKRYRDKQQRGKNPNNKVPTGYYSTIIDTMSGYMFNNVQYIPKSQGDQNFSDELNKILYDNDVEVKDMNSGTNALAYNKAVELVYTTGNGEKTEIKFCNINPDQMILVYNNNIEPSIYAGIYIVISPDKNFDYYVDVIYNDEWQYYTMKGEELLEREQSRQLFFSQCPVISYNTEILNDYSSFNIIIPYIDALDYVITGNSNEMERLVDAILKLSMTVDPEKAKRMDEWKYIEKMQKDDIAEYIQKDSSPEFRNYVSKLLIQEIHKHSHVIDWYSPDEGRTGDASGKALVTRLFDMEMFSNRLEKVYRKGAWKRISLITEAMNAMSMPIGEVDIIYQRTQPDMKLEVLQQLKDIPFLTDETKREIAGIDEDKEQERIKKQKDEIDITEIMTPQRNENGIEE